MIFAVTLCSVCVALGVKIPGQVRDPGAFLIVSCAHGKIVNSSFNLGCIPIDEILFCYIMVVNVNSEYANCISDVMCM